MVKVLVVDDEYFAREGMKRTVDWKALGCNLCGEADNAFKAIELAKELTPDIIITDINMPGMNGIQMANNIKEFLPDCKFIIITGYDQFEYAKGAIKLSAVDFLLKPIDEKELIEAVIKASELTRNLRMERVTIVEKLLLDSMRGKFFDKNRMMQALKNNNIIFEDIIIVNIENDNYEEIIEKGEQEKIYIQNRIMREIVYKFFSVDGYIVECHQDKLAIIINGHKVSNKEHLKEQLLNIKSEFKRRCGITVTFGVSQLRKISEIKEAYEQSKEALKHRLYLGKDKIICYEDVFETNFNSEYMLNKEEKDLILLIRARDKRKIEAKLKQLYFEKFKINKIEEHIIRQISIEIVLSGITLLKEYNISVNKVIDKEFDIYKQAAKFSTIDELYEMVYSHILKIIDAMREVNVEAQETGIEKAVEYIKDHYCEEISLSDVAKYAYLSESYLSRKMKKVLGIGFTEYITKLRMDKALDLLKNPNAKITEVALKVGYPDYRYFSQIFKKHIGYSPSEFTKGK